MLPYLLPLTLAVLAAPWEIRAAPADDLVTDLPGLTFEPSFNHYSGYLQAGDTKFFHYWFVESSSNASSDPLVLWLNGGPGCSSLSGLLTENGPFTISDDSQYVSANPFAWNQIANIIYLESPEGVGFSFDTSGQYSTNDNQTAQANYQALKDFFEKFPEYADRDFYITGESYAGIYIPLLTNVVMQDPDINLKGFAIGNSLSDEKLNDNSLVYFYYYHGLIEESDWIDLLKVCCPQNDTIDVCDFAGSRTADCANKLQDVGMIVWGAELNPYNLYDECRVSGDLTLRYDKTSGKYVSSNFGFPFMFLKNTEVSQRRERALALQSEGNLKFAPPCLDNRNVIAYLNKDDVKKALHISDQALEWDLCSNVLLYQQQYKNMKSQYEAAIGKKLRILLYNGDGDMVCNFLGDQWFVDSLNLDNPQDYKAWFYTDEDKTRQNAGFVKIFDNFTFATIRGAGHMVPSDKPRPALEMFTNFIQNKPF